MKILGGRYVGKAKKCGTKTAYRIRDDQEDGSSWPYEVEEANTNKERLNVTKHPRLLHHRHSIFSRRHSQIKLDKRLSRHRHSIFWYHSLAMLVRGSTWMWGDGGTKLLRKAVCCKMLFTLFIEDLRLQGPRTTQRWNSDEEVAVDCFKVRLLHRNLRWSEETHSGSHGSRWPFSEWAHRREGWICSSQVEPTGNTCVRLLKEAHCLSGDLIYSEFYRPTYSRNMVTLVGLITKFTVYITCMSMSYKRLADRITATAQTRGGRAAGMAGWTVFLTHALVSEASLLQKRIPVPLTNVFKIICFSGPKNVRVF
jgi:hypothetical protein